MLNTLRQKVWLGVVTLAVTNGVISVIAYVATSLLTTSPYAAILITVGCSSSITIVFAWWLSTALMGPIDKLTLLAKGIERSPGMSLPKTTGSAETDELLQTIGRTSQQLVNFIELMDAVAAGRTDAAVCPLDHSDRLSTSFQRLVGKVTESIDAKKALDALNLALAQLNLEIAEMRRGDYIGVRREFEATKSVSDAFRSMVERQSELTRSIQINTAEIKNLTSDGKKKIRSTIEKDEIRNGKLRTAISAIADARNVSDSAIRDLSSALGSVGNLLAQIKGGSISPTENHKELVAVRRQFDAALRKVQKVGEQSLAITQVSKNVQDLARRSNMISLNTSIQAFTADTNGRPALIQEIGSLSERAENANKAIAGISDAVIRDVNDAQASLNWIASEISNIGQRILRDEESMIEITRVLTLLADLPAKIDLNSIERGVEAERVLQILEDCSFRSEDVAADLQAYESHYLRLLKPAENLRDSISSRRQVLSPIVDDAKNALRIAEPSNIAHASGPSAMIEIPERN